MINAIIRKNSLQPCTHEPCLYSGTYEGEEMIFLCQVDNFAVACKNTDIANEFIDLISSDLSTQMKKLGVITRFNGVDVKQTEDYIQLHSTTFLKKILKTRQWDNDMEKTSINSIPMRGDNAYMRILDNAEGPTTDETKEKLEEEMEFSYRVALGEVLFAMITCRPDISFAVIKLSKFASNPAKEDYIA